MTYVKKWRVLVLCPNQEAILRNQFFIVYYALHNIIIMLDMDGAYVKACLKNDSLYWPGDDVMDRFLDSMYEIVLSPKEVLIASGSRERKIYILTEGIMRQVYTEGASERTYAFAESGTLIMNYPMYGLNLPAYMRVEACCNCRLLVSSSENFIRFMRESNDFSVWIASRLFRQLGFYEMKMSTINGKAKERFITMLKMRPNIIKQVPLHIIASYLGVTPEYLSRLKKRIFRDETDSSDLHSIRADEQFGVTEWEIEASGKAD